MVTAPHHLAALAGRDVLREGGNAVEAVVAAAAALSVVYPHMTGIGGDGFWLIRSPGQEPIGIDASGASGTAVTASLYRGRRLDAVPIRGPLAANTMAGAISGWQAALAQAASWQAPLPLARLLEPAIHYAETGAAVTESQHALTVAKFGELADQPGFAGQFLGNGKAPEAGSVQRLPALARTLRRLAEDGLDDFYRGRIARDLAADLAAAGSPLLPADFERHRALSVAPLSTELRAGRIYNLPPPCQGIASLLILALFDRLGVAEAEGFDHIHGLVEATKQAFRVRDRVVEDPAFAAELPEPYLEAEMLDRLAASIDRRVAAPWPSLPSGGDTVWLGAIDGEGRAASYIQSIYFEFGSGVVLPETGIVWQNRGSSLRLADTGPNRVEPYRRPFHTLNPAMASLRDGRFMVYGTMGGEGQPQSQAAVFSRYAMFGQPLQHSVTAPRWLLGRTWGDATTSLKLEGRFDPALVADLRGAGHVTEIVPPFTSMMGHAGALVRRPDGMIEGASDPRSDGMAVGF
jgi:gamma-glutamyltranspeptidase/glutathione hydrolase